MGERRKGGLSGSTESDRNKESQEHNDQETNPNDDWGVLKGSDMMISKITLLMKVFLMDKL